MKKTPAPYKDFQDEEITRLPGIRKYLSVADHSILQETLAFLARKNLGNDLFIKTLLSPAVEKEDDSIYYKSLIYSCLKTIIPQRKRTISYRTAPRVGAWLDSLDEVSYTLSTSNNFRELWLLCKNIQYQFCTWLSYDDISSDLISNFMTKNQEYIELCYKETPAALMKLEILHFEIQLLNDLDFPILSAEKNPALFLIKYNQQKDNEQVIRQYLEKRKNHLLTNSKEKSLIDQAEFFLNSRYHKQDFAVQQLLAGYNKYNNLSFLIKYIIDNKNQALANIIVTEIFNDSYDSAFLEENILKLHQNYLIDENTLHHSYFKLFLYNGNPSYLNKAIQAGYSFDFITDNLETLEIENFDPRYIHTYLAFDKIEEIEAALINTKFFTELVSKINNYKLNSKILNLIVVNTPNYLQNFVGPKSHEVVEALAYYLKRENQTPLLRTLKDLIKKKFPERKFLLKQI